MNKRIGLISIIVLAVLSLSACSILPASLSGLSGLDVFQQDSQVEEPTAVSEDELVAEVTEPEPQSPRNVTSEGVAALQGTLETIYSNVNPSVVNIHVVIDSSSGIDSSFGFPFDRFSDSIPNQEGVGSGFVWDVEGHIVTNNHVVENASKINVTFEDGRVLAAELVGADPDADVAVVKVETDSKYLKPVKLADSSQVKVGQLAIAIGNPYALQGSMTVGIISALERSLPVTSNSRNGISYTIPEIIQTDAPINPGNSGGVLLNDRGELIGVPTAIESSSGSSSGIGFVIPSAIVSRVVPQLIENGYFQHPWLGISGTTLTSPVAEVMDLSAEQRGVLVVEVTSGSPAEKAGLKGSDRISEVDDEEVRTGGDVIVRIGDEQVEKFNDVASYLVREGEIGTPLSLVVLRDGKETKLEVVLAERPRSEQSLQTARSGVGSRSSTWLGIKGITMNVQIASAMDLDEDQGGVLVVQLVDGSPADKAGLKGSFESVSLEDGSMEIGGDIIVSFNGEPVNSMEELTGKLADTQAGDEATLGIIREGKEMNVEVTLEERPED